MNKQKTLLEEETKVKDKEQKKESTESKEQLNGDFQELMKKDFVLDKDIQKVLTRDGGKCDQLSAEQQAEYKNYLCIKIGVSPTLQPIDLIPTKNGLRPYLNRGAAELIRDTRKISITSLEIIEQNGMYVVTCKVMDNNGRIDCDMGACPKNGTQKIPMNPNDSLMKAVTKAKRRATLSMCGLGAIIEESHPTEYNGDLESNEQPKSSILLEENEAEAKKLFRDVVVSKIGDEHLDDIIWGNIIKQSMRLANTISYEEAARWLQQKGSISLEKNDDGNVVKAAIKEVNNVSKQK